MGTKNDKVVKGIIFDFDNTLVDTKGASLFALEEVKIFLDSETIPVKAERVIQSFQELLKKAEKDPNDIIPIDDWRTDLWLQALGDKSLTKLARQTYHIWKSKRLEAIVLTAEVKTFLHSLQGKYKLLLLTNGDPRVQREKLDQCKGWDYFDTVMISGDFPYEKPEVAIFKQAFQKLKLEKDDCIMVGDGLSTDIQGGVNAGVLATVWVQSQNHNMKCVQPEPTFHITSVLKLNDILHQLNGS